MKRLFVLILVLLAFAIGCGNTDPSGGDNNTDKNGPMPDDSPVYKEVTITGVTPDVSTKVNKALNEGVKQLGDLTGYKQFYYTEIDSSRRRAAGEVPDSVVRKVYVKDGSVKFSEMTFNKTSGFVAELQNGVYSLGTVVTDFSVDYHEASSPVTKIGTANSEDYKGYSMYDAKLTDFKEKEGNADWSTPTMIEEERQHPLLIKMTDTEYSTTSGGAMEKDTPNPNNYKLYVNSNPVVFADEVVSAGEF